MNVWNKVLVGLIILTSLPFCYFAVKTLDVRKKAGDSIVQSRQALKQLEKEQEDLLRGNKQLGAPGLQQLRAELFPFTNRRGRLWTGVTPKRFDRATGAVMVQTTAAPPKDAPGGVQLFVFQDAIAPQEGAAAALPAGYLGEFTIANVGDGGRTWQLAPVRPVPPERWARIEQGRGTWTLYETMPTPDPDLVALSAAPSTAKPGEEPTKSPAEAPKKLDSAQSVQEFAGKSFHFDWYFNEVYRTQAILTERLASAQADVKSLDDSVALEVQANANLQKHNAELTTELAAKEAERDLVLSHQKAVEARLAELTEGVEGLLKTNRGLAAEIARLQLEATRRIDQRVRGVVQTASAK